MSNIYTLPSGLQVYDNAGKTYNAKTGEILGSAPTAPVAPVSSPAPMAAAPTVPTTSSYLIKSGDTLSRIASTNNTTVAELMKINPQITNPNLIYAGKSLTLPGISGAQPGAQAGSPTIYSAQTPEQATAAINANQQTDMQKTAVSTEPPTRKTTADVMKELTATITPPAAEKPVVPDFTATYTSLREQYGVNGLETQLNSLQAQQQDLLAQKQTRVNAERGKPVATNVIAGRLSEVEKQENERLAAVQSSIQNIQNQLTTKYNVVDTLMKTKQLDYSAASDSYDKQMSNNISLYNAAKGITEEAKSDEEKAIDDARSNLQIIYNNLSSSGTNIESLDPAQKANIQKLELQAGLPQGFYKSIAVKNPKSDILSTTTRESGTTKYADVIIRNSDGSLSTKTITLGSVSQGAGTKPTEADKQQAAFKMVNQLLTLKDPTGTPYLDAKGYLSPSGFKAIVTNAVEDGISRADFLSQYGGYIDPDNMDAYGLTAKERTALIGY